MMDLLFHEVYGTYYAIVNALMSEKKPISSKQIEEVIHATGFSESAFLMLPSLENKQSPWHLFLEKDEGWCSVTQNKPPAIQTDLERRWLKSLLYDSRLPLLIEKVKIDALKQELEDVDPLFDLKAVKYYDQFKQSESLVEQDQLYIFFQVLIQAIQTKKPVGIEYRRTPKKSSKQNIFMPTRIEYSPKNNLFRLKAWLIRRRSRCEVTLNLNRMLSVSLLEQDTDYFQLPITSRTRYDEVTCILVDKRKALQRSMLHFADYQKTTQRIDETHFELTIKYDRSDETELLIRILSFGPFMKVISPNSFISKIKERLIKQQALKPIE